MGILQGYDIRSTMPNTSDQPFSLQKYRQKSINELCERNIRYQIPPTCELAHTIGQKYVPCRLDRHNVRVFAKGFEGNGVVELVRGVSVIM